MNSLEILSAWKSQIPAIQQQVVKLPDMKWGEPIFIFGDDQVVVKEGMLKFAHFPDHEFPIDHEGAWDWVIMWLSSTEGDNEASLVFGKGIPVFGDSVPLNAIPFGVDFEQVFGRKAEETGSVSEE